MLEITTANFKEEVLDSPIPVLVDFWANWCGPCRMLAPVVEEIASEYAGKVKVGKINTDEQQKIAIDYKIQYLPTLMLFVDGKPVDQLVGFVKKEAIVKMLG